MTGLVTAVIATWTEGNAAFPDVLEPLFASQIGKGFAEWEMRKLKYGTLTRDERPKGWIGSDDPAQIRNHQR